MPGSSRAWMTRLGAVIVGRIGRTSIRNAASIVARAIPGLVHTRSNIASWRSDRTDGSKSLVAAPVPHAERALRPNSWRRASCSVDGVYSSPSSGTRPCPQLGRVAIDVVPPCEADERERVVEDERPRPLRSCCREHHGGRSALAHTKEDGLPKARGIHDGLDLGRSIIQRSNFRDRVREPESGLVEQQDATERGQLLEEGLPFGQGPVQLDVAGEAPATTS